ncbi:uncharacterized protein [Henckelia pumila]|uniref:uncharacterized protein isoform X2 n=1 Tax=Henckelia pumila TaxID=405737 RepID=UPI003C6E0F8F
MAFLAFSSLSLSHTSKKRGQNGRSCTVITIFRFSSNLVIAPIFSVQQQPKRIPGVVIEHGLVNIFGDMDVSNMYSLYKDSDLVTIWIEETMPEPEMMLDELGNIVPPNPVGYIEYKKDVTASSEVSENEIDPKIQVSDQVLENECNPASDQVLENESGQTNCEAHVSGQHLDEDLHLFDDIFDSYHQTLPFQKPSSHDPDPTNVVSGADDDISDSSEFDDSSDENYSNPSSKGGLDDVQSSTDEDIFVESLSTEGDGFSKEKKIRNEKRGKSKVGEKRKKSETTAECEWYSDGDEDDVDDLSMKGSDEEGPRHPTFKDGQDMKNFSLVVGMKFKSAQEFREVLRDHSVRQGYELVLKKNERTRITGECKNGCNWRIHASLVMGGPIFQIKTISGQHNCARINENKLANYRYLGRRIEKIVRDNCDIKIDQLKNTIRTKCGVEVSKWKVIRAKKAAVQNLRGINSLQYHRLWDYCETVRNFNPRSSLFLQRKEDFEPPTFDKLYFSLNAMKCSFLAGCRPIIGLDGCFLKTTHGGQLLAAVGRDGNDNMVPIAFAVVQVENRENWAWFLQILLEDIGGIGEDRWTFISDRQKGLVEALRELVPNCEHRYCLRHMYQNFKKKFKSLELKDLFWKAATTGNKNQFEELLKKIEQVNPKSNEGQETSYEWLKKIPAIHWARSHFSSRCLSDCVVNNFSESFNSFIIDARDKPIITMLECIRNKLMKRIQVKKTGMEKYIGQICPNILRRINKNQKFSRNFFAIYSGENEYQVQCLSVHGVLTQHVVDLLKKTCTCGMFQLCGYPCSHACTAIGHSRLRLEDFVHNCYSKDEYLKVYSHMIHAVPGELDYCKTPYQPLNAPVYKSKKGRPQRMRRRQVDEETSVSTRKGLTHTCSRCLKQSHNKSTCKNPIHPRSKYFKGTNEESAGTNTQSVHARSQSRAKTARPGNTAGTGEGHVGNQESAGAATSEDASARSMPYESLSGTPQSSGKQDFIGSTSFASNICSSDINTTARRVQMSHLNRAKLHANASVDSNSIAKPTGGESSKARATAIGDATTRGRGRATATAIGDSSAFGANSSARATTTAAGDSSAFGANSSARATATAAGDSSVFGANSSARAIATTTAIGKTNAIARATATARLGRRLPRWGP